MYDLSPLSLVILVGVNEEKFSRYEIKEELGHGGMATVYRAYDPMFEREVALKILKKDLLDDPLVRDRFERETKIIAKLEHAAIVPVYDVGHDNNQLFFVMRYMAGGSLSDRIQKGSLSLTATAYIIQRIASALDYAHNKGVIHRDLKPGNILFDEYGNAYISDFGIAKLTQAAITLTHSGIIGTPAYMSPEQAQGDDVDGRSDIYSLGVILFEILSGRTPFQATAPLAMAMKQAIDPIPDILQIKPDLPSGIEKVMEKVLAKDREKRYAYGAEFADSFNTTLPEPVAPDPSLPTPIPPSILKNPEALTFPPPSTETPEPAPSIGFGRIGGVAALILVASLVLGYPRFIAPLLSPPETVTITTTPPTLTATPTESITPTIPVTPTQVITSIPIDPGIGGANKIALTANKDIYIMGMDGSGIRQLTNTDVEKFDLQWLPSGTEILYGEGNCVYKINAATEGAEPEKIACFNSPDFDGFRISPDGKQVAISLEHRLLIVPFDLKQLADITSTFELQNLQDLCLDYADVAVKGAQWSTDGRRLAIMYQSIVGHRLGDTIRVLEVDTQRCLALDPLILDEFPAERFIPRGYERFPILPSFNWDGDQRFVFSTFERNDVYGEAYLYDMSTATERVINPVDGVCCYHSMTFSPDGTHILLVFQDLRLGANSATQLYYVPIDQIATGAEFTPLKLPPRLFPDAREYIHIALRPATSD